MPKRRSEDAADPWTQSRGRSRLGLSGDGIARVEVWHRPVQAYQQQQALDEARHLPRRQAEEDLHQTGLDGGIAVSLLSATPTCRRGITVPLGEEPYR